MLNGIIRFALQHRLLIVFAAVAVMVYGSLVAQSLPIDVLPDLTRPRVVLVTECPGMAPEEVEQRVTFPLETAVNGASGVMAVRSSSDIGLSVVNVEFDWGTDIFTARQIVQERVATVVNQLPEEVRPQMGPISSLLGQILIIGMWSETGETKPRDVRTIADWEVRRQLLNVPGISQVIVMGGGRKQYHVLANVHSMHKHEVTLSDIERAMRDSNFNVTGGYVERNSREFLVRGLGRVQRVEQLEKVVVKNHAGRPVLLEQVAEIRPGIQPQRGDSSVNGREAVVLTVQKQPEADTRALTERIEEVLEDVRGALPEDVRIKVTYQQREFIDYGVANVVEALRDGAVLVVVILFLFLLNVRTTFITLTAIPLSVVITALVFTWFDMSINVMTLGGIAVAMGELVDDAIVDVENIFRRLKQNAQRVDPRPVLRVIFDASVEVRNAIVVSTILVIVVFAPLFALSGMEGRLFTPLGVAYIVSILASMAVSLTVTPVLSYFLLPKAKATRQQGDGFLLRALKVVTTPLIRMSMSRYGFPTILSAIFVAVVGSVIVVANMGKDFLPPFDEGAAQVNLFAPPGTSLETSREISRIADEQFRKLLKTEENPDGPLLDFTCRTGRAEMDEHVMGVNVSEYVIALNPESGLSREELIERLHESLEDIPSVEYEVEQPIAHLISHMLSGVTAQIAIKLYGDDLDVLRREAGRIKRAIEDIPGIAPPVVEQQQIVPQMRIELRQDQLAYYGITAREVNDFVETALRGRVVSQLFEGQRYFDVVLRLDEPFRRDLEQLHRTPLELPDGTRIPLQAVARVYEAGGPNTINREGARRRIVVRVNTLGRDLGSAVREIEQTVREEVDLPSGYFVVYGGQFEARRSATRRILWLSLLALVVVFLVLYSTYPSASVVLQILVALPTAFVGGVLALLLTGQTLSVAGMVGFISLGGIAARNGLLLVSTYLDLIPEHGFSRETILRGSLERLAPVLMTALTTGIGLVPLVIGGHLPGKELLFPVATVILGGLVSSTLCEFLLRPGLFWTMSRAAVSKLSVERAGDHQIDM